MGLLDKLQTAGSNLSAYDGTQPAKYNQQSNYLTDLAVSQLDLDGKQPKVYDKKSNYENDLAISQLDLNGLAPKVNGKLPYLDNLPK
jgi:hypothetical protein